MRDAIHEALERDEITAWFQPQVDVASGALVGAEALCRWTHPDFGAVPPTTFIPLAEELGLIDAIGQHMAEQALDALTGWAAADVGIDVSVNVSPLQLTTPAFSDWLADSLRDADLEGCMLTLEITESEPIEDVDAVAVRFDELRALGLGIAIDDFGVGHATLALLKELRGTELKLDRSLIIDDSEPTSALLVDVVGAAHADGVRIVAEGIETPEQWQRIADLGCDRAQGYYLGKPMPRADLEQLLIAERARA